MGYARILCVGLVGPDVPQALDDIVMRAMHRSRDIRYAGWQEFSHDLAQFARTQKLTARHTLPSETQRFQLMRAMPFFQRFDDVHIWEALHLSSWREVSAGSLVMREGDAGSYFALLASGHASICSHGLPLYRLAVGECFGEMSLFGAGQVEERDVGFAVGTLEPGVPALAGHPVVGQGNRHRNILLCWGYAQLTSQV